MEEFLLLELGGVDVIMGVQWLHTLGVTEVDWRTLTMKFVQEGKTIVLIGDSSLQKLQASLKWMMKTWEVGDQGIETWEEFYGIEPRFLTQLRL